MTTYNRWNQYRIMWLMVLFDLPTDTKRDRKAASKFRKNLLEDGFEMFQFSIYMRHCPSRENAEVHKERIKRQLPRYGKVAIFHITDRQFGMMEIYHSKKQIEIKKPPQQLEMF